MRQRTTPVSRRRAIGAGTLAAVAAGFAAVVPPTVAAGLAPTIDRAEALLLEIYAIVPHLSPRDQSNLGHVLEITGQAAGLREDLFAEALEEARGYIGSGNRVHDQ